MGDATQTDTISSSVILPPVSFFVVFLANCTGARHLKEALPRPLLFEEWNQLFKHRCKRQGRTRSKTIAKDSSPGNSGLLFFISWQYSVLADLLYRSD